MVQAARTEVEGDQQSFVLFSFVEGGRAVTLFEVDSTKTSMSDTEVQIGDVTGWFVEYPPGPRGLTWTAYSLAFGLSDAGDPKVGDGELIRMAESIVEECEGS